MRKADRELFDFFKLSDGRVVTTKQVAVFLGANPATREGTKTAAYAVRRLRMVLPLGWSINMIRHVGYTCRHQTCPAIGGHFEGISI